MNTLFWNFIIKLSSASIELKIQFLWDHNYCISFSSLSVPFKIRSHRMYEYLQVTPLSDRTLQHFSWACKKTGVSKTELRKACYQSVPNGCLNRTHLKTPKISYRQAHSSTRIILQIGWYGCECGLFFVGEQDKLQAFQTRNLGNMCTQEGRMGEK
jgi:hypothetical protein